MLADSDATRDDNDRKFQWQLEVYKQLHETCRHHYRLEWQLLQVGVITAIGVLTFGFRNENSVLQTWSHILSGVALVFISYAMHRQAVGYLHAMEHLVYYAGLIRDPNVRKPGSGLRSAAVQGRAILLLAGTVLFFYGVWKGGPVLTCCNLLVGIVGVTILFLILYDMVSARNKIEKKCRDERDSLGIDARNSSCD